MSETAIDECVSYQRLLRYQQQDQELENILRQKYIKNDPNSVIGKIFGPAKTFETGQKLDNFQKTAHGLKPSNGVLVGEMGFERWKCLECNIYFANRHGLTRHQKNENIHSSSNNNEI